MNGAVWTCKLSCNRESWWPSHALFFVFAGVTAAAPCSTPSVVRKLSRALAVFAENSTTRGRPLSGHLTTTAPGAFSCPTRTPETRTKAVTVRALSDHCAGQSACFVFFPPRLDSWTNSETENDLSVLCTIRFGFLLTHTHLSWAFVLL